MEGKLRITKIKWIKITKWALGIIFGLILFSILLFKAWVSTWQTYRNDEFGFSFRYPKDWYIGGTEITKKQLSGGGSIFFWVDKEKPEIVEGSTELRRSNGDVVVFVSRKFDSKSEFFDKLSKSKIHKLAIFGNKSGYEREGIGGQTSSGLWMSEKYISVDLNSNSFGADTLTYAKNNPASILIGRIEHKIGSTILDSINFD